MTNNSPPATPPTAAPIGPLRPTRPVRFRPDAAQTALRAGADKSNKIPTQSRRTPRSETIAPAGGPGSPQSPPRVRARPRYRSPPPHRGDPSTRNPIDPAKGLFSSSASGGKSARSRQTPARAPPDARARWHAQLAGFPARRLHRARLRHRTIHRLACSCSQRKSPKPQTLQAPSAKSLTEDWLCHPCAFLSSHPLSHLKHHGKN